MIRYAERLFLTEKTKKDIDKIKFKLLTGRGMVGVTFIELSSNEKDVFDLIPAAMFKQKNFRKRKHFIIGVAESPGECYALVRDIVMELYEKNGSVKNLRQEVKMRLTFRGKRI